MTEYIEYPSATAKGYEEAHEGDGVVLVHKNARGTVQDQKSPTLSCRTGGGSGVVVNDKSETLPNIQEGECCAMLTPGRENKHQNGRRFKEPYEPSFSITCQDQNGIAEVERSKLRIRYLTERECLRLMGQPDDAIDRLFEVEKSKTERYKMAGNSIVVDVLEAIFKGIYIDGTFTDAPPKQSYLDAFF